jgi:hypothetical protein
MGDEPLEEIKRGEHPVPRWINALWLGLVACLVLTSIVMAVRLGDDFAGMIALLVVSSMAIFVVSAVAYVALYGLSILLEGLDYHKAHCDDSKHFAGMVDFMR